MILTFLVIFQEVSISINEEDKDRQVVVAEYMNLAPFVVQEVSFLSLLFAFFN